MACTSKRRAVLSKVSQSSFVDCAEPVWRIQHDIDSVKPLFTWAFSSQVAIAENILAIAPVKDLEPGPWGTSHVNRTVKNGRNHRI